MTSQQHDEAARRTAVCSAVEKHVLTSVSRHAGPDLDEVDEAMYQDACKPLLSAIWQGEMQADSPAVWKLIFDLRNAERRPRADQVAQAVRKALRLPEPSAPIEARNVVTIPNRPVPQIPAMEGATGEWMRHLRPSGSLERDAFLVDVLSRTERAMGPDYAAHCARRVVEVREEMEAEREAYRLKTLEAIPEEHRDNCLRLAGGDAHKALRIYIAQTGRKRGGDALSQWKRQWESAGHAERAKGVPA